MMKNLRLICVGFFALTVSTNYAADILFMQQNGNPDFDAELVEFMEGLGHTVTLFDTGVELTDDQFDAAEAHDLVYITESVGSATMSDGVETWIKESETPQIWAEAYAWDEAAITGDIQFEDFGNTQRAVIEEDPEEEFNEGQETMFIVKPGHPLAGGFTGEVQVYEDLYSLNWGLTETLGPGAEVIASVDPAGVYASLFTYEKGALLEDETPAAGIRVGFWLGQAGLGAPVFDLLSENGLALIEAAINYTLGTGIVGDPCDFDGDGSLGLGDVNALLGAVNAGANDLAFDVTGDGVVNGDDIKAFVTGADKLNSYIGDVNLDGEFNSSDFVKVFQEGLFETGQPANWEQGDFNGDNVFSSGDFVAAFQDGGFEIGPRVGAQSVPEPNHVALAFLAIMQMVLMMRRK